MKLLTKMRWANGGMPTRCARCYEQFSGEAHHGKYGYYCSVECKTWAEEEATVEDRARKLQ